MTDAALTCTALWPDGVACGKPAVCRYDTGCVHEHLGVETVCENHAWIVANAAAWVCTPCQRAGERAHECPVTIITHDLVTND